MGKNGSKHECFLVDAHLNKTWEEQIWKTTTKTGCTLANYNMNQSMSELSICLEDKQDNLEMKECINDSNGPLKESEVKWNGTIKSWKQMELPPIRLDTDTGKVFTFDHIGEKEKGEKEQDSRLSIEEFECGVHFGGGDNSKQEWSFTLYDFDGHGKITKEDLVGLLKALYDAIGSSVKIPNNGTKTLKLRLSVGQESNTLPGSDTGQQVITSKVENMDKSDANSCPNKMDNSKSNDTSKPKVVQLQKGLPKMKVKGISKLNNLTSNQKVPNKCINTLTTQSAVMKPRLSLHKNKELAQLVQANMERNHVRQLRRHHSDCRTCPQVYNGHALQNKRCLYTARTTNSAKNSNMLLTHANTSLSPNSTEPTHNNLQDNDKAKESQDRRNYYLDLAGVENTSSKFPDSINSALAKGKDSELNSTLGNTNTSKFKPMRFTSALSAERFSSARHLRSRSHDLNASKVENNEPELGDCCGQKISDVLAQSDQLRSRSFNLQESKVSNVKVVKGSPHILSCTPKNPKFRPVSLPTHVPHNVSPHYHQRHRHREKDHDLAMQQVEEWIEREHMFEFDGERVIIEHHHVHEHHHHHHYHHYYEA